MAEYKRDEAQFLSKWPQPGARPVVVRICEVFAGSTVFRAFEAYQKSVAARVNSGMAHAEPGANLAAPLNCQPRNRKL
jgi:hypothetical protein